MENLPILYDYNLDGIGNSSVPLAFCQYWNEIGNPSLLYAPSRSGKVFLPWLRTPLGPLSKKLVYRFSDRNTIARLAEKYFFKKESKSKYVYLWAGLSLDVFENFHRQGVKIIIERINCHQATAKSILDNAYAELGLPADHAITDRSIDLENRKLAMAEGIFCPSPMVYKSMIENGVPPHKLLSTSYGWLPARFPNLNTEPRNNEKIKFLFVGTLSVRKGVPLLLQAWDEAKIDGELILCGSMEPNIKQKYGDYFQRDDIVHIPFTQDIGDYYNSADVFVFPSLEEGGPMVTYEAMAHGVIPLVSEMGAGAIVQDRKNGLILPHDKDAWVSTLKAVAKSKALQLNLGRCARQRALNFTWENVAAERAKLLKKKFPSLWNEV